ncbi:MAG: hypothetical protein E6X17_00965 [Sporomusaceae bacterium]|nr:hypothetical protein [Sporomusaceae bacterium]
MRKPLLLRQAANAIPTDLNTILRVFTFDNLAALITPDSVIQLTPDTQAALVAGLNSIQVRDGSDLSTDLQDVLDVFIIANAGVIATAQVVVVDPSAANPGGI